MSAVIINYSEKHNTVEMANASMLEHHRYEDYGCDVQVIVLFHILPQHSSASSC